MKDNKRQFHGRNTDNRLKVKGKKPEKKPKGNFDPNKPKRPPSPFFIFLDDFRREFNEANPDNKSVGAVGKAAGKKWKSMTEEDKEPFAALARSKKSEYAMNIQEYNMKLATGTNTTTNETKTTTNETKTTGDAESDKPKSEVKTTGDAESDKPKSEVKITGDAESDKPKSEVNDEKEIGSATSDKESGSGEEKKGDDKEVGPGICV